MGSVIDVVDVRTHNAVELLIEKRLRFLLSYKLFDFVEFILFANLSFKAFGVVDYKV